MIKKKALEFLEAQGFVGLSDREIAEFDVWLRFARPRSSELTA